jgi:hypothetical protein
VLSSLQSCFLLLRVASLDGELGVANEWRIFDKSHVLARMFLSVLASRAGSFEFGKIRQDTTVPDLDGMRRLPLTATLMACGTAGPIAE